MKVHHLVASAFHGDRPNGLVICHRNGDPQDNRASNLRYDTQSSNLKDMYRHGRQIETCINGHRLTAENIYENAPGRKCKICQRARTKAKYHGLADYRVLL